MENNQLYINFRFITSEVEFEETFDKGATITATVMELDKASMNDKLYRIAEGDQIARSLEGKPVYYGTDPFGRHDNPLMREKSKASPVGFVETAKVIGNKIKALIKITNDSLIQKLKKGLKFRFSVGGHAISETIKKIGDKMIHILTGAKCNHLQIVDPNVPVGFPSAELERIVEINETVMFVGDEIKSILKITPIRETIEVTGRSIVGYEEE